MLLRMQEFKKSGLLLGAVTACLSLLVVACGGGGGGAPTSSGGNGPVSVSISVAPTSIVTTQGASLTWSANNANACTASGAWGGSQATSGAVSVSQASAGTYTYSLTCSGASGNATGSASLTVVQSVNNSVAVVVDGGPTASPNNINMPYVSVTVCRPGTSVCQTIDHILLDTGSFGLRLIAPGILNSSLNLPAVTTASGAAVGDCAQFASGYQWGSVRLADVQMAGELASSLPINVVSDPSFASVPSDCSSGGANIGTVAGLGANGILGVGLFKEDCGSACAASAVAGTYYACSGGACSATSLPLAQQVQNPVPAFAHDNNGVLLVMPAIGNSGASSPTGTMYFGIGTQGNNAIASETVYSANNRGDFTTNYNGKNLTSSYLDSGSNGYYFDDTGIRTCSVSTGFYCPSSPLTLSAVNTSSDGRTSGNVVFTLVAVDSLSGSVTAANIGGTIGTFSSGFSSNSFDWGLPFFFGRRIFVAIEGSSTPNGTGPYWAY
jgi:hypothetical protein